MTLAADTTAEVTVGRWPRKAQRLAHPLDSQAREQTPALAKGDEAGVMGCLVPATPPKFTCYMLKS